METNQFDQGTILTRIRSEKYPGINCYGILITASCDIAQRKVQKYYYVTAINAKQWLTSETGYREILGGYIGTVTDVLKQSANGLIDFDSLIKMPVEEAKNAIDKLLEPEKKKKPLLEAYENYSTYEHPEMNVEDRRKAINKFTCSSKRREKVIKVLDSINKGGRVHYYYLPMKAFGQQGEGNRADLIADFQEIGFFYLRDLERIDSPGFDPSMIDPDLTEYSAEDCARYRQLFYMDDTDMSKSDNSVANIGCVQPPWREHFMQSLSFSFSRIGLEDVTETDYINLLNSINDNPLV